MSLSEHLIHIQHRLTQCLTGWRMMVLKDHGDPSRGEVKGFIQRAKATIWRQSIPREEVDVIRVLSRLRQAPRRELSSSLA